VDVDVYQIDHEDANGQFEINYTYADCLTSADHYLLFKMAASEIANDLGMICSFMPKPFANRPGNGMHIHMSIGDGKTNLFADKTTSTASASRSWPTSSWAASWPTPRRWRPSAPHGQQLQAPGGGPLPHRRHLGPGLHQLRRQQPLVDGAHPHGRLELRLPDGACNPYLATAAVIAAGLDGIERELDPGEPHNQNLYALSPEELKAAGIEILPQNLHEALLALEKDTVLCKALGPVAGEFLRLKHMEWVEYMRHVSDWEIKNYLEFF
jgi:glutamine synthetase